MFIKRRTARAACPDQRSSKVRAQLPGVASIRGTAWVSCAFFLSTQRLQQRIPVRPTATSENARSRRTRVPQRGRTPSQRPRQRRPRARPPVRSARRSGTPRLATCRSPLRLRCEARKQSGCRRSRPPDSGQPADKSDRTAVRPVASGQGLQGHACAQAKNRTDCRQSWPLPQCREPQRDKGVRIAQQSQLEPGSCHLLAGYQRPIASTQTGQSMLQMS